MGEQTKIQWTDHTLNPWRGCQKVSPGCTNCYAEKQSKRNPTVLGEWGPNGRRAIAAESYWQLPFKWNRAAEKAGVRRRVFCASLADVFEDRPDLIESRTRLQDIIERTTWLDWLLLTKRPENAQRLSGPFWQAQWPPNVWLGVSVENQEYANERIPVLLDIPARIKFLSCEPLLGPIDLSEWLQINTKVEPGLEGEPVFTYVGQQLNWVIIGGESGPLARACNLDWIRSIVNQCQDAMVACFVKQLGAKPFDNDVCTGSFFLKDPKGGDPEKWPADLRVREFPE